MIIGQKKNVMEFLGVDTQGSMSLKIFPDWASVLGIDGATLRGVNLPIDGSLEAHYDAMDKIKHDSHIYGALVTSHKLSVVRAAGHLIDHYTDESVLTGEVSALYKREGKLWGHAVDPENCGLSMAKFLPSDWWIQHKKAGILILGGGGACIALIVNILGHQLNRPSFIKIVEKRADNLKHCSRVIKRLGSDTGALQLIHSGDPLVCDQLISDLPPYSMVINATGMGKDIPGSPITDASCFPMHGVVWELNYRGSRAFLHQALQQSQSRSLIVEDGWYYFMRGWSSVIGLVFDVQITPKRFEDFCAVTSRFKYE
ncbi:MAG: shikimate dehydrogenase [Bacteroidetes bacterium]|nr:shikimate dehydrogenase [Bacteroidota bacterium]MCY4234661.1 shikimate dehydrogenase [Bacteroidota bacterium]